MSKVAVKDQGNHKTSIWLEVSNNGEDVLDMSASHMVGTKSEHLRIGFENSRQFPSSMIEIDPDETVVIRIAPPIGKKIWVSGQIIKIIFSYQNKKYERFYKTGTQYKKGVFISNFNILVESSLSEKDEENVDNEPDNIENPEDGDFQEPPKSPEQPEFQEIQQEEQDKETLSIQQMHQTLEQYSTLRTKVDDGNARLTVLQRTFDENRKRMLDSEIELKKEEDEIREASEICGRFEQQFKKIKSTIDKK